MNIEIGYYPNNYYSSKPSAGGFFPFAIEGELFYIFSTDFIEIEESYNKFLPLWMANLKAFPIYCCSDFAYYYKDEFEVSCNKFNIKFCYLVENNQSSIAIATIQTKEQLENIIEFYIKIGSNNETVVWSINKNVFNVERREWSGNLNGKILNTIIANIDENTTMFWVGYDGASIVTLSNQAYFSTYEKIIQTLPKYTFPTVSEYGEE